MSVAEQPVAAPPRRRLTAGVAWLGRLYLLALLAVWALLTWAGDAWWPATVLLYLPRWPWALPLLVLLPAAYWQRRERIVLLVSIAILLAPVMGLCLPWRTAFASSSAAMKVRVLSLNIDRSSLNAAALEAFILETDPDIVACQDWTSGHDRTLFQGTGWYVRRGGQFCLASRYPILEVEPVTRPADCADRMTRYRLETPTGPLDFFNVRLKTPREALLAVRHHGWNGAAALERNSDQRRSQSVVLSRWIQQATAPALVAGDFNTLPESTIWHAHWTGFTDAWTQAGFGFGRTYRNNRTALRIDHQLAGPGWQCMRCWIGPPVGSEHLPLVAEWEWVGE